MPDKKWSHLIIGLLTNPFQNKQKTINLLEAHDVCGGKAHFRDFRMRKVFLSAIRSIKQSNKQQAEIHSEVGESSTVTWREMLNHLTLKNS